MERTPEVENEGFAKGGGWMRNPRCVPAAMRRVGFSGIVRWLSESGHGDEGECEQESS